MVSGDASCESRCKSTASLDNVCEDGSTARSDFNRAEVAGELWSVSFNGVARSKQFRMNTVSRSFTRLRVQMSNEAAH